MIRALRVCIYGGMNLKGRQVEFSSELAYELLRSSPTVIVTGGFRSSKEQKRGEVSTDVAALRGAERFAQETGTDLKRCYEAWLPDPALDDRPKLDGVVRLSEADGVSVRVMAGRTALGRRLAMVAGVDLVVTIAGRRHTEVVVEQALERGIPVLPIPNAGGDSERLLAKYRARIAAAFESGAMDRCLRQVSKKIAHDRAAAARAIVELVRTAKVGRCLVLLPYDAEHNELYGSRIEPAVAKWMVPTRLDRFPKSEEIQVAFAEAVRTSAAVIADITDLNENVMYEIGYARASGITPLIYTRKSARLENLPVYFRTMNVRLASPQTPVEALIDGYLRSIKATPIVPPIPAGAV